MKNRTIAKRRQATTPIAIHTPGEPTEYGRMDTQLLNWAKRLAQRRGITLSQFVETAIVERFAELKAGPQVA